MVVAPSELELMGRVALAAACGAAIGLERELVEKPAGLRTHALVALGAAAFAVAGYSGLSLAGNPGVGTDVTRMAAQVVNGIGFLGAGLVIFHGDRLRGITTAAEMWAVAAIGVLSGLGETSIAAFATAIILIILVGGRPVETWVDRLRRRRNRKAREKLIASGATPDEDDDDEDEAGDMDLLASAPRKREPAA